VLSPPKILDENATVSHLIDTDMQWWNVPLLEQIFSKEERVTIQSLPISARDQADLQIWRTKNRVFFDTERLSYFKREGTGARSRGIIL
jgi:hypothetical protein